jgi:hypothetical protein
MRQKRVEKDEWEWEVRVVCERSVYTQVSREAKVNILMYLARLQHVWCLRMLIESLHVQ